MKIILRISLASVPQFQSAPWYDAVTAISYPSHLENNQRTCFHTMC